MVDEDVAVLNWAARLGDGAAVGFKFEVVSKRSLGVGVCEIVVFERISGLWPVAKSGLESGWAFAEEIG